MFFFCSFYTFLLRALYIRRTSGTLYASCEYTTQLVSGWFVCGVPDLASLSTQSWCDKFGLGVEKIESETVFVPQVKKVINGETGKTIHTRYQIYKVWRLTRTMLMAVGLWSNGNGHASDVQLCHYPRVSVLFGCLTFGRAVLMLRNIMNISGYIHLHIVVDKFRVFWSTGAPRFKSCLIVRGRSRGKEIAVIGIRFWKFDI